MSRAAIAVIGAGLVACTRTEILTIEFPPEVVPPATEILAVDSEIFVVEIPGVWKFPGLISENAEMKISALIYPGTIAENGLTAGVVPTATAGHVREDFSSWELEIEGGAATAWRKMIAPSEVLGPHRLRVRPRSIAGGAGQNHTCFVTELGTVYCWGDNSRGQQGREPRATDVPVLVEELEHVVALALGRNHTCALLESGKVACMGENRFLELGRPSGSEAPGVPLEVVGPSNVVELEAGSNLTCARDAAGAVICWGTFFESEASARPPTRVDFPGPAERIGVGTYGACAVAGGRVFCFGRVTRLFPATECGSPREEEVIEEIAGFPAPVLDVKLGDAFACARLENDELWCWGCDNKGQLGRGIRDPIERVPEKLLDGVREFDLGAWYGCAVLRDGKVTCWGENGYGQLATGEPVIDFFRPQAAVGFRSSPRELRAYWEHACALLESGEIVCWGRGQEGQIGDGVRRDTGTPSVIRF